VPCWFVILFFFADTKFKPIILRRFFFFSLSLRDVRWLLLVPFYRGGATCVFFSFLFFKYDYCNDPGRAGFLVPFEIMGFTIRGGSPPFFSFLPPFSYRGRSRAPAPALPLWRRSSCPFFLFFSSSKLQNDLSLFLGARRGGTRIPPFSCGEEVAATSSTSPLRAGREQDPPAAFSSSPFFGRTQRG